MRSKLFLVIALVLMAQTAAGWLWGRRRRRRSPPPPPSCDTTPCSVSYWSHWGSCSLKCGKKGTRSRTRYITQHPGSCGSPCLHLSESEGCNRRRNLCQNYGTQQNYGCSCRAGFTGTCCGQDLNECLRRPCQHYCKNTEGSYWCSCRSCYTKQGTRCRLERCKIRGTCYRYGAVNPSNSCQYCTYWNKQSWTNNNALPCNDGIACTRNDHCSSGTCVGTRFTCLPCEECYNDNCRMKPYYCVIPVAGRRTCFRHGDLRSRYPCQQCDSNTNTQWTNNNNLPCNDNNIKTKDDRCYNGACVGTPYPCLFCEMHDGSGCPPRSGYCVIQYSNQRTCFSSGQTKPGNPCQICNPASARNTWINRNGISCNDADQCTSGDKCFSGQCIGTPFTCNSVCQYCNGSSCSLKAGFGYANGNCACKIGGQDYPHQSLNPSNQCQWCDLHDAAARASSFWSNRPAVICNDNNNCTKQDICSAGRCVGQPYSCQASYLLSSCIETSVCVGDGTCRDMVRTRRTICRAAKDVCDQPEKCDGVHGLCPLERTDPISASVGTVQFMNEQFSEDIGFQYFTNRMYFNITGFAASCGQIRSRWFLLEGKSDCIASSRINGTLVSTNLLHNLTSLALQNNQAYKIAIEVRDIRERYFPPVCTRTLIIDTTTPKSGWIRDGPGTDISYQSTKLVQANWGGVQTQHGVLKYQWKVLYTSFQENQTVELMPFTTVNLNTRASKKFDIIKDGSTVKTVIRAYTKARLFSDLTSDGVIVDTSPPRATKISDGHQVGVDLTYVTWSSSFRANWEPFTDPHSSISYYTFTVKRVGAGLITIIRNVALRRVVTTTRVNLISGERYCAVVKGYNLAGLYAEATSDCVLVDHDAPRAGSVNDGVTRDIDYQSQGSSLSANWNGFHDNVQGSGIVEYRYKVTDSSDKVVVNWTSVGNRTSVSSNGMSLMDKERYFVTVRAQDAAGLTTDVTSDGVTVDLTHPVFTGNVTVTGESGFINGTVCFYVPSVSELQVQWSGFSDSHSGLEHYEYAVISSSYVVSDADFKRVPVQNLHTSSTFSGLNLDEGKPYSVIIRAFNRAGLHKDAPSILIVPYATPPGPGKVFDGATPNIDIKYSTDLNNVHATWTAFSDIHSGVKQYYYAVGSCQPGNYHVTGNRFIELSPSAALKLALYNTSLTNGQQYCVKIKAKNLAGLYSIEVSSNGFLVDSTPPSKRKARIYDGLDGSERDHQRSTTRISAHWEGFSDHESGVKYYEYVISRSSNEYSDAALFRNVGLNISIDITGLNLETNVYYVIVCAVNFAGLRMCSSSDGVLIDPTPPNRGIVHDGKIEPDIRYQTSLSVVNANWEGIWDLESQIENFEWSIGTSKFNDKESIQNYTDVGLSTHVQSTKGLKLVNGGTYYVHLRVTNKAGSVIDLMSDGVTVDVTPPHPVKIFPGYFSKSNQWTYDLEDGSFYSSSMSIFAANWNHAQESESELWYYKWAIGTSRCGTQVQPFINVGRENSANTTNSDLRFVSGTAYYVTVIARNRADLLSQSCSDPFIYDNTPPAIGKVTVGPEKMRHRRYITWKEQIIQWDSFFDPESAVKGFEIQIIDEKETLVWNATAVKNATNIYFVEKQLAEGESYHAIVSCFNKAGLYSKAKSLQFTIDTSPPFYNGSITAGVARDNTMQYQAVTNSITATWYPFTDQESPIKKYEFAVGTSPEKDDVVKFEDVRLSNTFTKGMIQLSHSTIYYASVRATNAAGLSSTKTSIGVLIDTTPPLTSHARVFDGQDIEDIGYFSTLVVAAHWEGFRDPESGILKYEYCLGTSPSGCQIRTFVDVGNDTSFECHDCGVIAGETVFVTLRVTNKAGLTVIMASDGMLFDSSPPIVGQIIDTKNGELPTDTNTVLFHWNVSMAWTGAHDRQSGLKKCTWTIESAAGEILNSVLTTNVTENKFLSYNVAKTYHEISENTSEIFYNVIHCLNKAGLQGFKRSNGFRIKRYWPMHGAVRDGPEYGNDWDFLTNTRALSANWDLFIADGFDPITKYAWAVGTSAGQDDVLKMTHVGLATSAYKELAPDHTEIDILTPGKKYYVTVKATCASGVSTSNSSNGFIVDPSPPVLAEISVDHYVRDQESKTVDIRVEWYGVKDEESGIAEISYSVGTTPGTCNTQIISSNKSISGLIPSFQLQQGVSYYVTVIVRNGAGLITVATSHKLTYDLSPPSRGYVLDGYQNDIDFTNNTDAAKVEWGGFEDNESGVKKCTWIVLQQEGFNNNRNSTKEIQILRQSVPASGRAIRGGLSLIPQYRYINQIACENRDGFVTAAVSDGVKIDVTPPFAGTVHDGSSVTTDVDYLHSNSSVQAVWDAFQDTESGIVKYKWGLGTSIGSNDVMTLTSVGRNTSGNTNNVTLVPGLRYYVTVEAINGAGMAAQAWSDGFLVDDTAPELTMKSKNNQSWIGPRDKPTAAWKARDSESGIYSVGYCVGTTPQGCQIKGMTSLPSNSTSVTCQDCSTVHRVTYFVTVRVGNGARLFTLATSAGVKVDLTPPYTGKLRPDRRYTACTTNCILLSLVSDFEDEESGVKSCRFAVRNESAFITTFEAMKERHIARASGLNLVHGQRYYMTVACENNVGLETDDVTSSEILVDSTSPLKGSVIVSKDTTHDVLAMHSSCHLYNNTLRAHWFNFSDDESGISTFRVAFGRQPYGSDIVKFTNVGITTNVTLPTAGLPGLYPGCIVYVTVEAENGAGLVTQSSSPPTRLLSLENEEFLREGDFRCLGL